MATPDAREAKRVDIYPVPLLDVPYRLLWLTKRQWAYVGVAFEVFMQATRSTAWPALGDLALFLACVAAAALGCLVEVRGRGLEHWVAAVCAYRVTPRLAVWRPGAAVWEGD